MTLDEMAKINPKAARVHDLVVVLGLTIGEAAKKLGEQCTTIRWHLESARHLLAGTTRARKTTMTAAAVEARKFRDEKLAEFGRCTRCCLLKPCVCLPANAGEIAYSRPSDGPVEPDAAGWG